MLRAPCVESSADRFRTLCDEARVSGVRVGLVPTMGAIHEGHLALVRRARETARFVAVSIFVNPTQFGPNEDFSRYPRDLGGDVAKLAAVGTDLVFAPDVSALYPPGDETRVRPGLLADSLCGAFRPGHFEGVATVVSKLFHLTGPCVAVFGKKDYQQLAVIRRMVRDLFFPVEVIGHPIVRDPDGLAMSSRNAYLTPSERARARSLARGLAAAAHAFDAGERRAGALRAPVLAEVTRAADGVDYVEVADADGLTAYGTDAMVGPRTLVAIACRIGQTRLIDNVVLGEDLAPLFSP